MPDRNGKESPENESSGLKHFLCAGTRDAGIRKPELLAPAGYYHAFIGAVNAGADAVYFGGTRYGARAFADNITQDEARDAIRYARLNGVKTYLTVNTLVREDELAALSAFLEPYVEAGLSGAIVQDFGVAGLVRTRFPSLSLHASTQMAVTGAYGAKLLKRMGFSRVVPARELTLPELARLRREADIEVEAFVHGAMCYSYSGMCLFSAIVGGRSGNRGRCAQACRLPYRARGDEKEGAFYLSMKDLNSLAFVPDLIRAGVDSFKIEGRMKKPAYAAGVTAVYRKYIDRFFADPAAYRVDAEDLERLNGLYQRTETGTGYLTRHNDRALVTYGFPGYAKTDEALLAKLEQAYLRGKRQQDVTMRCVLAAGKPLTLTISCETRSVTVTGETVQAAKTKPLTEEDVKAQLSKTGDTVFHAVTIEVTFPEGTLEGVFVPVKAINEVRRRACAALEEALLAPAAAPFEAASATQAFAPAAAPVADARARTPVSVP